MRLERKKRDRERLEIKRRKERQAYLETLAKDLPKAWKAVKQAVERGLGPAYDEACRILLDLFEAYSVHASREAFHKELKKFMAGHMRRKTFVQRLVKAGIWKDK
jgi:hypothetical protein